MREFFHNASVRLVLFLLGRGPVAAQVQEFRAEQADAVSSAFGAVSDLLGELNVAVNLDADPVLRFRTDGFQRREPSLHRSRPLFGGSIFLECGFVRVNDDRAVVTVDDDGFATGNVGQEAADTDDCRDFDGTRQDCGVRGAAADFGRKPQP